MLSALASTVDMHAQGHELIITLTGAAVVRSEGEDRR